MLGGLSPSSVGRPEHHPAVGDQHLVARVHPQHRGIRPPRAARRRCRCAARRRGRRRPGTAAGTLRSSKSPCSASSAALIASAVRAADVQQPVAELDRVDLGRRRRAAAARRAPRRARCRPGAAASRRPPSRSTSRSAIANPASGVSRSSIISTTLGVGVAMPSSRPAVSDDTTMESAPDCRSRCWFSASRTAAMILAFGRELAGGQRDQHRGVVAVGGDDDRLGVLRAGQPQHVGLGGVAVHGDQAGALGALQRGRVGVDDDDVRRRDRRRRSSRRPRSCPWCRSRRRRCDCALCSSIAGSSMPGATAW